MNVLPLSAVTLKVHSTIMLKNSVSLCSPSPTDTPFLNTTILFLLSMVKVIGNSKNSSVMKNLLLLIEKLKKKKKN